MGGPPRLGNGFDEVGLGHMGLLTSLLDDLDALGSDSTPLRSSANDFVRMWERAEGQRSGQADPADDIDLSGVTVLPSHQLRKQELPKECGESYCPGALESGVECRFNAECESGVCTGAGDCGNPTGVCQ